jgi:hypothetical protein
MPEALRAATAAMIPGCSDLGGPTRSLGGARLGFSKTKSDPMRASGIGEPSATPSRRRTASCERGSGTGPTEAICRELGVRTQGRRSLLANADLGPHPRRRVGSHYATCQETEFRLFRPESDRWLDRSRATSWNHRRSQRCRHQHTARSCQNGRIVHVVDRPARKNGIERDTQC